MAAPMRVAVLGATLAATTAFTCTPSTGSLRLAAAVHELRPSGMPVSASQLAAPKLRGATVLSMAVEKLDKRKERRRIVSSENFNRRGFAETKEEVEGVMVEEFTSDMIKELKANDNTLIRDNVTVKLATDFGFCWGVERAVAMAYEARSFYQDDEIHITNEIIHNPGVNARIGEMGINFVPAEEGVKDFSKIKAGDVVILPAFGASLEEMQLLDQKGVRIVDTTCPWVSKVWNAVDTHQRKDMTSVIHGKWAHEESIATASFCEDYVLVKDMDEAKYVAQYMLEGGNKEEFLEKFKNAISKGFDPDVHLKKVGIANQTTMYKEETAAIAKLFERTALKKFGPEKLNEHFMALDTICDATQERQDAIQVLLKDDGVDVFLIVGGWDSSNTAHLLEIVHMQGKTGYHIDAAARIKEDGSIEHRDHEGKIVLTENFLPKGKLTLGITSGASTPDRYMQDSVERVFLLKALEDAVPA